MNEPYSRSSEKLNVIISNFLKKYKCFNEDHPWKIRESSIGGFGVFARRDINVGEAIFKDFPVIIGSRASTDCPLICVVCFTKLDLKGCARKCGLPICSENCQNSETHLRECNIIRESQKNCNNNITNDDDNNTPTSKSSNNETEPRISQKLFNNFTPIRALLLDSDDKEVVRSLIAHRSNLHGHEIDVLKNELKCSFTAEDEEFIRFVCCVMDANIFEMATGEEKNQSSIRGLYPLGSLANHRCYPNATYVFDKEHRMVCKAAVFIPQDSEIFHSYSRIIWGTVTRLYYLKRTKHFVCECDRCKDPTEFKTYMSAVLCKKCRGNVIPLNPYKVQGRWQCEDCKIFVGGSEVGQLIQMLGSILHNIQPSNFEFMYNFLKGKLSSVVPRTNQVAVELQYKIIWLLGHKPGYKWEDLPTYLLNFKKELCEDILELLKKLNAGKCKMVGLLLYELYCCYKELQKRDVKTPNLDAINNKVTLLLKEAKEILEDDVLAPQEIRA